MKYRFHALLALGFFSLTNIICAQVATSTGSVYGKVVDEQRVALPGVNVQLNSDVMPSQSATTGPSGAFRFAKLPPGNYTATFSLQGFTDLRQEGIRVTTGLNIELEIVLKNSPMEELTIIGETPLLDPQKTGHQTTYSRESLDQIPGGRDPWFVIEQTPGIDSDRFNVAGSESGQQSIFTSRGGFGQPAWNLDGINVTDFGGASFYPDFDSFEEIEILAGGNDASIQTGSVAINLVTKRGGNQWSGNASYYFVDDALQSSNTPQEVIDNPIINPITGEPAKGSNRTNRIQEYGFDIGGPVIKDKLFMWGAFRRNQIELFQYDDTPDNTRLLNYNLKGNLSWNQAHESEIAYLWSDKSKEGRLFFPGYQAPETAWDQAGNIGSVGLEGFLSAQHTWIPNDHMLLTARYGYMGSSWGLIPRGGKDIPMIFLGAIPLYEDTFFYVSPIEHPAHDLNADANYFKEDWMGGDHEFKFGFVYSHDRYHSFSSFGNGVYLYDIKQTTPGGPLMTGYLYAQHPVNFEYSQNSYGMYISDTYRKERLTLDLGVRFDHQTGKNNPSSIAGVPGFEEFVGGFEYPGGDPGIVFNNVSPRIGVTYDLKGDGKTILRGNFARYYDAFDPFAVLFTNPTITFNGAFGIYENQNGDRTITPDELSPLEYYGAGMSEGGFDLDAFLAKRKYAEDLSNARTNEFIAGVEREVVKDVSLSATYTYRQYGNFLSEVPFGVSPDDYVLAEEPYRKDTSLGSFVVPYYVLGFEHDGTALFTNVNGYSRTYHGLDLVVRKRMNRNFMLNGSLTLQTQNAHYDGDEALGFVPFLGGPNGSSFAFDPTLLDFVDDQAYLPAGRFAINPFSEWYLKMSGYYQLPWDLGIGAFFRYQQGYPFVIVGQLPADPNFVNYYGQFSPHLILVEPYGSRRHENKLTLDLRVEKRFAMEKFGSVTAIVDIFNITNENAVLRRGNRINSNFNRIFEVFSPRAVRLGLRFSY